MYGYAGKIARVNLTTGAIIQLPTSSYVPLYHGARGLGAKLYWDENVPVEASAFDPRNALVFATGPAAGTLGFGTRTTVLGKSPESIPECYQVSTTGGNFGPQLKFAGFDAVVVTGKAPRPSYILVRDGEVRILNADSLWGLGCCAADKEIRQRWGDRTSSMLCGPAGENLCKGGAVVINDLGHATGNGSHGAVMGSKNLKAVAAIGTGSITVARPQALLDFYDEYCRIGSKYGGPFVINSPGYEGSEGFSDLGGKVYNMADWFNWETTEWSNYYMNRDGLKLGTIKMKYCGCWGCPALCQQVTMHQPATGNEEPPYNLEPPFAYGNQCHEYEYQNSLTQLAWDGMSHGKPGDFDCFMQADMGVSSHAIDTDWKWMKEANPMGLIPPEVTGLPTTADYKDWNLKEFCGLKGWTYALAHKINPFWEKASEGRIRFLTRMHNENPGNADWELLYNKYVPSPYYHTDHRSAGNYDGHTMLYHSTNIRDQSNSPSLSSTGKTISHYTTPDEINEVKIKVRAKWAHIAGAKSIRVNGDKRKWKDQVAYTIFTQNALMEYESSPACGWAGYPRFSAPFAPDYVAEPETVPILAAILGVDKTYEEWLDAMEPIFQLERAIHNREGRRREHDTFGPKVFELSKWTTKAKFEDNLSLYYEARGWDVDTAIPTRAKLVSLGMTAVADGLAAAGVPIT